MPEVDRDGPGVDHPDALAQRRQLRTHGLDALPGALDWLRRLNEAGVLGRFVPDFGRVVAQMQFDMYHHYTVDEHSIRAIGLLSRIEKGALGDDHPLATAILRQVLSRRVLYVAVLLHDIAKGRGGDHSILGAEVAQKLCPRLGLTAAETETVAWLVRQHLMMSATAFKRDLSDFKTVLDFAGIVQSPERLRLLLVLTDGKPNDLDVYEGRYGLEDTRHAVQQARVAGLVPFCVTIDDQAHDYMPMLFGIQGYAWVRRPQELVHQLIQVWSGLIR